MAYAFQFTGLDFAGPLFVKDGLKSSKCYILLLSCASSRAIHLELVPDMSIHGFLWGFKRFMARRGVPDLVISDNFKTFRSSEVKKFILLEGVRQRFILPASPWWDGYERLVKTAKACLKKTLGKAFVTFEELQTILCEIEVAVNNRPLAYVSEDDLDEALTPFHLMYGRSISTRKQFNSVHSVPISSLKSCKQRLFHLWKVLKDFWKRFRTSYSNELRQTNLYRRVKGNNTNNVTIEDVVLIKDDEPALRTQWRMGRVLQLVKGWDGHVQGARLMVLSKAGKQSSVHRPVQRLIPFEIREKSAVNPEDEVGLQENTVNEEEVPQKTEIQDVVSNARPSRKAAVEGQAMRRVREQKNF